jgi:hypothetical protein
MLGIAIAAMMPMTTTTISNSIRENPFWRFILSISPRIVWRGRTAGSPGHRKTCCTRCARRAGAVHAP